MPSLARALDGPPSSTARIDRLVTPSPRLVTTGWRSLRFRRFVHGNARARHTHLRPDRHAMCSFRLLCLSTVLAVGAPALLAQDPALPGRLVERDSVAGDSAQHVAAYFP